MQIMNAKPAAQSIYDELKKEVFSLSASLKRRPPHLAAILVGNNGASETNVTRKVKN